MYKVKPTIQDYHWGAPVETHGPVENCYDRGYSTCTRDLKTFAELWLGMHSSGMTAVEINGEHKPLNEFLEQPRINKPTFLFKVLSVQQPLSLQIHPSKDIAERLHRERPDIYKDDNHKPEMAVALTETFKCLAGFRSKNEILVLVEALPLLKKIFHSAKPSDDEEVYLRNAFLNSTTNKFTEDELEESIQCILNYPVEENQIVSDAVNTFRYCARFHKDSTLFSTFLLKTKELKRGQAIFLGPNVIHAYLEGDCIECMATSDNVVRGGLTPKLIDVPVLMKYMEFREGGTIEIIPETKGAVSVYRPPVKDFKIVRIKLNEGEEIVVDLSLLMRDLILGILLKGTMLLSPIDNDSITTINQYESIILTEKRQIKIKAIDGVADMWIGTDNYI